MEKWHPGYTLDDLINKKWQKGSHKNLQDEKVIEKNRLVVDMARFVTYNGSDSWFGVRTLSLQNSEIPYREIKYEYIGTNYVPLDANRTIAIREVEANDFDEEVKLALYLRYESEGNEEHEIIATFSENDSIELKGSKLNLEGLEAIEELLTLIDRSEK